MTDRRIPVAAILGAGVGLGFAADSLLRSPGEPGLNMALLFAGLAVSLVIVSRQGGPRISPEAALLMAVGVLSGLGLVWRGSELLRFLAFVAASTALALPALHAGRAWIGRGRVADLIEAVFASGAYSIFGSLRLFRTAERDVAGWEGTRFKARSVGRSALVGALLAAVPLVVFGALFVSADRVFAEMVEDFVTVDLEAFVSHLTLGAVLSWLACGYLVGFSTGTRLDRVREIAPSRPSLGTGEVVTALALVDVLFLGFVLVQSRYLFGGAGWVEVTPGMTYAAYAREGFFQLVVATALGLPWLLAADGLLGEREGTGRWVFRVFAGAQLLLLLAIVASAVQRMRVYLDAYGLTEDRFVAMAMLVWLALLVIWFGATVLRGKRSRFAFGALASAYGLVAVLHVANPAAVAARSHLDRAAEHASETSARASVAAAPEAGLDARYLTSLGSDAVPVVVERLGELTETDRCLVARRFLSRWGPDRKWDWRSWNAADREARRVVGAEMARLQTMAGVDETCG